MKKTMIITALALSAVAGFAQDKPATASNAAAKPAAQATPQAATADPVIITAGTVQVRQSEFEQAMRSLPQEYQAMVAGQGKRQFAEDYLRMKMLAAEGQKRGLDKDPDVLTQLSLMRENLVAQAALKQIESSITVADADTRAAYDADNKKYEEVKARHILISYKGSRAPQKAGSPERTKEQAKAHAEELRKQIIAGADFAELAKKESDDTGSGANGGDLGSFGHDQMVPPFEQAAFAAKVGEIPPVVETEFGFHILKVESHDYTPFEGVKGTLEREAKQKKVQAALDALKDNAKPTFSETYFAVPAAPAMGSSASDAAAAPQAPAPTPKP
ncbi:MAG TPA: peptidylprolyl isomerase [Thermoanaerobaculia bacterium]|nr:peptidylprolyl isomerase [Thermoanaerobaculia bacterium]